MLFIKRIKIKPERERGREEGSQEERGGEKEREKIFAIRIPVIISRIHKKSLQIIKGEANSKRIKRLQKILDNIG